MSNGRKAALLRCVDYRHGWGRLQAALKAATGVDDLVYDFSWPGGAGFLTELDEEIRSYLIENNIKYRAIDKLGAEKIILTVHGTGAEDAHGCGGYSLGGFADKYNDVNTSHDFSVEQLKEAAACLQRYGVTVPIEAYYVTFVADGSNTLERVPLEEGVVSPLPMEHEAALN